MLEIKIDKSKMICRKKLSKAEVLHRRPIGTNQTHIGLFKSTVTLDRISMPSLLIYLNNSYDTLTIIDPITNPNGSLRSPKIRQGNNEEELIYDKKKYESTYGKINEIVKHDDDTNSNQNKDFYIIWGTLTNGRLFLILYNNESSNLKILLNHLPQDEIFSIRTKGYPNTLIHNKLYMISEEMLKSYDLEESVTESIELIKSNAVTPRFFPKQDQANFQKIGKFGESLIDQYLNDKKNRGMIKDYYWLSQVNPTADHDFEVTDLKGQIKMIEVKSTINNFKQPFFWSKNERKLFVKEPKNYIIKRVSNVFDIENVSLNTGENMFSLYEKLNIDGIIFEGSTVYPNKIDIKWNDSILLKEFSKQ